MNRRSFLKALGLLSLLGLMGAAAGCKHEKQTAAPKVWTVKMGTPKHELVFVPDRLRIRPGDTVRWVLEADAHSATAYHPKNHNRKEPRIPQGAEPWDSQILSTIGASFSHTFTIEGVYHYYCIPHEGVGMVGAVVVGRALDGPGLAPPQEDLPIATKRKLEELIAWAKELK